MKDKFYRVVVVFTSQQLSCSKDASCGDKNVEVDILGVIRSLMRVFVIKWK